VAEMGLYPHKAKPDKSDREYILDIMKKTDTFKFADKLITELSGGEIQRVLLARALVQKPKLLLLDEAMSGFDIAVKQKAVMLLKSLASETGMSVIFIRHDIETAFDDSDRILAMKKGEILYNDKPSRLLTERFFSDIFNVRAEIKDNRFHIINIKS
jgi:iron complex transport system ATP-binding protein